MSDTILGAGDAAVNRQAKSKSPFTGEGQTTPEEVKQTGHHLRKASQDK